MLKKKGGTLRARGAVRRRTTAENFGPLTSATVAAAAHAAAAVAARRPVLSAAQPASAYMRLTRSSLLAAAAASVAPSLAPGETAAAPVASSSSISLPLERMGGGVLTTGAFIDGERFRLIVDTGSPYLVVPLEEKCAAQSPRLSYYGCASPGRFRAAGFPPTSEQYGALPGRVRWLKGGVRFGDAQPEREYAAVFGAADRAVMSQSGGALLGLIRQVSTQPGSTIPREDLRPTALAQLGVSSFSLDAPRRRLALRLRICCVLA